MELSNSTILVGGAVGGALFVGIAYAFARHTRQVLAYGLIATALLYVLFAWRGGAGPAWLVAELVGVGIYGAMGLRGISGSPWWLVAGWALHPVWDVAIHLIGPGREFAPLIIPIGCITWDPVVAIVVAASILQGARRILGPAAARAAVA
jgi:hypothetical protein